VVKLEKDSKEYKLASDYFHVSIPRIENGKPHNTIVEISKIYNTPLREYWTKELEMVKKLNNDSTKMEYTRLLWHGTSNTHPEKIYQSTKGWKLNFAGEGNLWGKGLYFSQDAIYSSGKYAFTTHSGTKLLLLADVILGSSTYLQETKETKKIKRCADKSFNEKSI